MAVGETTKVPNTVHGGVIERKLVDQYIFRITFENRGSTPALNCRIVAGPVDSAEFASGTPDFSGSSPSIIGPNATVAMQALVLNPEQIMATATTPVRFRVAIQYDTVFESARQVVTDLTYSATFIGRQAISEIIAGGIVGGNFDMKPGGDDRMT